MEAREHPRRVQTSLTDKSNFEGLDPADESGDVLR